MWKWKRRIPVLVISVFLCVQSVYAAPEEEKKQSSDVEISAQSAILMEASTGKIIYEKNPDEKMAPASVTKVMTMLLIFDAIEEGKIKLEDSVTVSEFAASMGGSQVYLEPGETQTVDTMLKCIAVASANDAAVAMAEYIAGSEAEFVKKMNERAAGLGMKNTHFENSNGLDIDGHLTTARDIALMSQELIMKYPKIHDYSMIWMENITHTTKKGTSEFGLSNTNKLVRFYEYATGLKTGSTSKAKFCLSATAKKNDVELVAALMAAPDSKQRMKDATILLNYGFGRCTKYVDDKPIQLKNIEVKRGIKREVPAEIKGKFAYIDTEGIDLTGMKRKIDVKTKIKAPVKKGDKVGKVIYLLNKKEVGSIPITAGESILGMDYKYAIREAFASFLL